jgi:hypothetical protein
VDLSSARRVFLLGLVGSMCATAALAIGILLFSEFDETAARILGSTAALSFFSLLALPAGVLLDRGRFLPLAWASLVVSAVGLVLVQVVLWVDWDDEPERLWKSALSVTAFAVAGAQVAATTSRRRADDSTLVRGLYAAGLALALALAAMTSAAAWGEIDTVGYYRALGALAVLGLLSTLLQPVLRRVVGAAAAPDARVAHRIRVTLADGRSLDREESGRDFAEAVARAVRAAERDGSRVRKIERVEAESGPS